MRQHTTLHKDFKRVYEDLISLPGVKKIILGTFHNCKHSFKPGTLTRKKANHFKVYCGDGYQDWYLIRE